MKINSKLFDKVRVPPRRAPKEREDIPVCDWKGCDRPGVYKAPKAGGGTEFFHFCLQHVRLYNQNFDYFAGAQSKDKLDEALRRAARSGERPTWAMGANPTGKGNPKPHQHAQHDFSGRKFGDPLNLFARLARTQGRANPIADRERNVTAADRQAMETLGLEGYPRMDDIKKAYKELVKKHHPDANGGDRASEDRLRAIIAAYTHLKKKGFA